MEQTPHKSAPYPGEPTRQECSATVLTSAKKLEAKIKRFELSKADPEKGAKKRLFASAYSRELFNKKVSAAVNIPPDETVYKNLTPLEFDTAAFLREAQRKALLQGRVFKPRKRDPEPPLALLETTKACQEEPSFRSAYRPPTFNLHCAPPEHSLHLYECVKKLDNLDLS